MKALTRLVLDTGVYGQSEGRKRLKKVVKGEYVNLCLELQG